MDGPRIKGLAEDRPGGAGGAVLQHYGKDLRLGGAALSLVQSHRKKGGPWEQVQEVGLGRDASAHCSLGCKSYLGPLRV